MEQYLIWKELLQSRQTEDLVEWWQEFYVYFYQAFIEGDRWMQYLKGVGEKRAALLAKLNILTIGDLLTHFPRQYEDWSAVLPIAEAPRGVSCCVSGHALASPVERRIRSVIETTWLHGDWRAQGELFGMTVSAERGKPTNAEFLFLLSEHIRLHLT